MWEITADEYLDSETTLIILMQRRVFADDLQKLKAGQPLSSSSKLCGLQPFIDDDKVIRANTRLQNADYLSYGARFPIVLPRHHHLVKFPSAKCTRDGY